MNVIRDQLTNRIRQATGLASLTLLLLSVPAFADGSDTSNNPLFDSNHTQQITTKESRSSSSWASRHTSFPEVPSEQAQDFTCFMTTENHQTFNLEALCGRSTSSNPQETQRPSPDLTQN